MLRQNLPTWHKSLPPHNTNRSSFLRYASKCIEIWHDDTISDLIGPNEQSVISREDLGYYYALVVAAKYRRLEERGDCSKTFFYNALKICIDEHSFLSVIIEDAETDQSYFRRVRAINFDRHVCIDHTMRQDYSTATLEEAFACLADTPFPEGVPPWKITVYPLQEEWLIAFSFSLALGDGIFGKAFHRTFSRALNDDGTASKAVTSIIRVPQKPLPPPFDTPERLPIS